MALPTTRSSLRASLLYFSSTHFHPPLLVSPFLLLLFSSFFSPFFLVPRFLSFIFFLFFLLPSCICLLSFLLVYVPPVLYVLAPLLLSILCNASCRHVPTSSTGGPCPTLSPDAETASEDRDRYAWTPYAPVSRVLFPCTASTNGDNVQGISAFQPPLRQDDVRPFRRAFGDSLHLQIRGVQFFDSFHWFSNDLYRYVKTYHISFRNILLPASM